MGNIAFKSNLNARESPHEAILQAFLCHILGHEKGSRPSGKVVVNKKLSSTDCQAIPKVADLIFLQPSATGLHSESSTRRGWRKMEGRAPRYRLKNHV